MRLRPAILLFGDSITQYSFGEAGVQIGWGSLLASAYQRRADVLNRGFSGYNTRHALELVPKIFGPYQGGYLFCTIFFGANDAALPGDRQHVPVEEYGENLRKIITSVREMTKNSQNCVPIIVMTPPPVDNEAWKMELGNENYDRTNENTRMYGMEAMKVAKDFKDCKILDTWELLGGSTTGYAKHLCDGLHLSESGNQLIFDGLMALIKKDYPHLAPQQYVNGEYKGEGIPIEERKWDELC